ncbi:MAG TPA: threonine synthase, partial [Candidatus Bathyarchaeota archaeon]|nr:threonine synthase [Candidatus Bathyarchaeota archaeon]HEX68809.1 threonine synthase [Candidatus Bathyarchaeota archaeon]
MTILKCIKCSSIFEPFPPNHKCPNCGGPLEYQIDYESLKKKAFHGKFNFWRYRKFLPETRNMATLGEGGTPLHKAERLA